MFFPVPRVWGVVCWVQKTLWQSRADVVYSIGHGYPSPLVRILFSLLWTRTMSPTTSKTVPLHPVVFYQQLSDLLRYLCFSYRLKMEMPLIGRRWYANKVGDSHPTNPPRSRAFVENIVNLITTVYQTAAPLGRTKIMSYFENEKFILNGFRFFNNLTEHLSHSLNILEKWRVAIGFRVRIWRRGEYRAFPALAAICALICWWGLRTKAEILLRYRSFFRFWKCDLIASIASHSCISSAEWEYSAFAPLRSGLCIVPATRNDPRETRCRVKFWLSLWALGRVWLFRLSFQFAFIDYIECASFCCKAGAGLLNAADFWAFSFAQSSPFCPSVVWPLTKPSPVNLFSSINAKTSFHFL